VSRGRRELHARRERLRARAADQREDLARELAAWQGVLSGADRGLEWFRGVKRHAPVLGVGLALGVTAVVVARPRILGQMLRGGLAALRLGRSLRGLLMR
jgi:hypothetical protein